MFIYKFLLENNSLYKLRLSMNIKKFFYSFKKIKDYFLKKHIFGFILSLILYLFIFFISNNHYFSIQKKRYYIFLFIIVQIFFQYKYFLHFKLSYKNYWYIIFLIFTALIISIICIGSLWVMGHLNH